MSNDLPRLPLKVRVGTRVTYLLAHHREDRGILRSEDRWILRELRAHEPKLPPYKWVHWITRSSNSHYNGIVLPSKQHAVQVGELVVLRCIHLEKIRPGHIRRYWELVEK